jgi:SNF2 family DNA or RNA helicase
MRISITEEKGFAIITPTERLGDAFNAYRAAIEGAKYDGKRRLNYATVDKLPAILKRLRESDFDVELSPELADRLKSHTAQMWIDLQSAQERLKVIEDFLAGKGLKLFPFQRSGVQWLATRMGALLADEMGLGKTVQATVALPPNAPVLIVCPSVAKGVWRRELKKWGRTNRHVEVIEGRGNFRWPKQGETIAINYDILPPCHKVTPKKVKGQMKEVKACDDFCEGCLPFLKECEPGTVVIADEGHALKNPKSQRAIKFRAMGTAVRSRDGRTWILTATPLLGKAQELWAILQAAGIAQEAYGSWKGFVEVHQGRKGAWGGYEWGTPLAEAGERLQRVCLRRLRKEVLPELPVKTYDDREVEVDAKTLKACDAVMETIRKLKVKERDRDGEVTERRASLNDIMNLVESKALSFETLSKVRHALALAKIPAVLEMVEDFEEQEEPVVVFSAHRALVEKLMQRPGWAGIHGDVPPEERTRIEDDFQNGKLKGVAATIQAGGVAITLTRAHICIFADREWTPALNAQGEDRICRIGQERGCLIIRLHANHVLDERIGELLSQKQKLIEGSVDAARVIEAPSVRVAGDDDYADMIRKAEEEVKYAQAPKPPPPPKPSKFRKPATPQEEWAAQALMMLSSLDPDRAAEQNDVGFNSSDGGFGHSLAEQLKSRDGLSEKQWGLAIRLCQKYWRQVGECPKESA